MLLCPLPWVQETLEDLDPLVTDLRGFGILPLFEQFPGLLDELPEVLGIP